MTRKWALQTRYRLRRNTASTMKTFNCYLKADLETFYQISLTLAQQSGVLRYPFQFPNEPHWAISFRGFLSAFLTTATIPL